MCGIIGIIKTNIRKDEEIKATKMLESIRYRGPDGYGIAKYDNCILGHRRLSIIDLSTGDQPMYSTNKKIALVFNGEIYGYRDIKNSLKNYQWKTQSDTEVILALYETYGINFINKLPGMFSFALWDETNKRLIAGRDRFGEKPFYYAYGKNNEFIFASEIKAIIASGLIEPKLSRESLKHYLHKLYVNPNKTIYENVYTLPPAHYLTIENGKLETKRYWSIPETNEKITLEQALPKFRELLTEAVKKQLVADVPVGALLSGGLDSTTIVALASKYTKKIKTFSFGFEGTKNELHFAKIVADKYKTDHYELHDKDNDIAKLIIEMANIYDEPFGDSSNIATYSISKLTKKHVTVVLTGDGGDELLGGYYGWYRALLEMNNKELKSFPGKILLMKILSRLAMRINYKNKAELITKTRGLYYRKKFKTLLNAHRANNVYFTEKEINDLGIQGGIGENKSEWKENGNLDDAMKEDISNYMPGDILVKIDRASMANSLELRAPFLDVSFAEFAISLPFNLKINKKEEKVILRRAFEELWPEEIRKRSKLGFGGPVNIWMQKEEVKKLIKEYLKDKNKKIFKYLSYKIVQRYLLTNNYKVWVLLTLSVWMEKHSFK